MIEPPLDGRRQYAAGDALEFGLVLIGRGNDYLPYFLFGFEELGRMGLGRHQAQARLERVEALYPWQVTGQVVYQNGRVLPDAELLPSVDAQALVRRAHSLPTNIYLKLLTPLRVKTQGDWLRTFDLGILIRSLCWRLNALAIFHGSGPWQLDYRPLIEQAQAVHVDQIQVQWVDWERTSTRPTQQKMTLGGIIGSVVLHAVPPDVQTVLLAGSLVHVGKACVFGHGGYSLLGVQR